MSQIYQPATSLFARIGPGVTTPGVPASTTVLVNPNTVDCMVYITGGTVTVIAINGTATGLIAGSFYLPVGGSIAITWSVTPTWAWFGVS